ncbi:MAG: hypothetical protein COA97_10250 [Flavobacteriales bacterium]|nr:MAG: hypothetical protein COA97_10250 [Flavobacteriales bacterium]
MNIALENVTFLNNSLEAFDRGQYSEVKRIASTIRTLIHDTNNSQSLIKQIESHPDLDKRMTFFDKRGVLESWEKNTVLLIDCSIPRITNRISLEDFNDVFDQKVHRERWWERMVLATPNSTKKKWSRKDLVLNYANKEGGSHVDPKIPVDFIEAQNSIKYRNGEYELGIGYLIVFEAGFSMKNSLYNYLHHIKEHKDYFRKDDK